MPVFLTPVIAGLVAVPDFQCEGHTLTVTNEER
jgi:hypothetical protein